MRSVHVECRGLWTRLSLMTSKRGGGDRQPTWSIFLRKKATCRYRIVIGFLSQIFSRHWLAKKRKKILERSSPLTGAIESSITSQFCAGREKKNIDLEIEILTWRDSLSGFQQERWRTPRAQLQNELTWWADHAYQHGTHPGTNIEAERVWLVWVTSV